MTDFARTVKKKLKVAGYKWVRQRGSHEIWSNEVGRIVSVPHKIRKRHTANEILKQAGLPKISR